MPVCYSLKLSLLVAAWVGPLAVGAPPEWGPVTTPVPSPSTAAVWALLQTTDGSRFAGADALYRQTPTGDWQAIADSATPVMRDLVESEGALWVAHGQGVATLDLRSGAYRRVPFLTDEVWQLAACDGKIVGVTRGHILVIDPATAQVETRQDAPNTSRLLLHALPDRVVIVQPTRAQWTFRQGALHADRYVDTFAWMEGRDFLGLETLSWRGHRQEHDLTKAIVTCATAWGDYLYVGTFNRGLFRIPADGSAPRPVALHEDAPQICGLRVIAGRLWVATVRSLHRLEPVDAAASLRAAPLPQAVVPGPPALYLSGRDSFVQGQPEPLPRAWCWDRDADGRTALGLWGEVWYGGHRIEVGGTTIRGMAFAGRDLLGGNGQLLFRLDPSSGAVQRVALAEKDIAAVATLNGRCYFADFDGSLFEANAGSAPRALLRGTGSRGVQLKVVDSALVLASESALSLPLSGRPPSGLPERFSHLQLGGDRGELLGLLRDGPTARLYRSADGADWQPLAVPFLPRIGQPASVTADRDFFYLCGDVEVLRIARITVHPARPPAAPTVAVRFDGHRPEEHSLFAAVQRVSLHLSPPASDTALEPAVLRYRLRPIETAWTDADRKSEIEFSALRAGRYSFEVEQVRFGLPSAAASVEFAIPRPWFLRWPSLVAYTITLPLLGFLGFRLRLRQVFRRNEELQQLVRARTGELEKANSAKSEFLAMMSHEIRNPMNGVIGLVQNLRDSISSPRDLYTLKLLAGCAEQLRATVDDVLDFSKIEAGEIDVAIGLHSVAGLIREALAIAGQEASFTLENLPAETVQVPVDAPKVRQILVNYLTNALKYGMPAGGTVGVLLQDHTGRPQLTLSVRSAGPTIAKEVLDSLFDAFTRGDDARRSNIRGTGLGLAICRKFAQRMGGNVGAVSANGETTFYLTLPLDSAARTGPAAAPPPPPPPAADQLAPAKALAIEDEDYNRVVLASILAKLNYSVDWASNGREALQLAQANGYDVVLTDLRLPDINGTELTRRLLALCPDPKPAVFAVTAYSTREKQQECIAAGMAGFISKPITLEKLHRAIHHWGKDRLGRVSIERSTRSTLYPEVAANWRALRAHPTPAAAHALNNLCRHHGLVEVAEQLELLEAAQEGGRDPEPFLRAAENLLATAGAIAPS